MKYFLALLITLVIGVCFVLAQFYSRVSLDVDQIVSHKDPLATQIFDTRGRLIANVFNEELRFYATYDEIPPRIVESLIAMEDTLFFEHDGINFDAILRAMIKNAQSGRYVEGGSTITQQLIKNVALTREKTIERKIKEAMLSFAIEKVLTKEQILEKYLNHTYFGHGFYGIKTASRGYFRKEMDELSLKEIAVLVSLPKAPSFYDPTKNYQFSMGRANSVIARLEELGWISSEEAKEATLESPKVYNDTLTKNVAPYVVDEVLRQLQKVEDIKTGGYKIYVTVDLDYQNIAQESLEVGYEKILGRHTNDPTMPEDLNGAMVVMENSTGRVMAMVGGVNYAKSSYNRVTQSRRQVGSSFKPFIYLTAVDLGLSPTSQVADIARTYQYRSGGVLKTWQPKNYGSKFAGIVTLKEALTKSMNLATINLVEYIGFERMYDESIKYGFENVPKNLSISLGSFSSSPLEMARSYSVFSNYGTMVNPILIERVENHAGKSWDFTSNSVQVTTPEQSYLIIDMLRNAVQAGTGRRARTQGIEIAGKSGTSNDNMDSWFCGFSPSLETIIWFGRDSNRPIAGNETGGITAAPVANYFFERLLEFEPSIPRRFDEPNGVFSVMRDGKRVLYTSKSPLDLEDARIGGSNLDNDIIF